MERLIGVLPAAGAATRLRPFRYPKELVPVCYTELEDGRVQPMVAAEYSLVAMRTAGIPRCLVVIADWKTEIVRYLGDGSDAGIELAYLHRGVPRGLADAIEACHSWVQDSHVCLALPDTIFRPFDAIAIVCRTMLETRSDLVLGVFPTDHPEDLGPVRATGGGRVVEVLEKPEVTDLRNTWGVAAWSPRFTALLHRYALTGSGLDGLSIGTIFNGAIEDGLDVRAVPFPDGSYTDLGAMKNLQGLIPAQASLVP
jgi:glucose-1-phosphate thymidylyltransferase